MWLKDIAFVKFENSIHVFSNLCLFYFFKLWKRFESMNFGSSISEEFHCLIKLINLTWRIFLKISLECFSRKNEAAVVPHLLTPLMIKSGIVSSFPGFSRGSSDRNIFRCETAKRPFYVFKILKIIKLIILTIILRNKICLVCSGLANESEVAFCRDIPPHEKSRSPGYKTPRNIPR